jgi:hypothetical protein
VPGGWLAKPRKTLFCSEKREQYAAQENCVSRNKAERAKLNYLPCRGCWLSFAKLAPMVFGTIRHRNAAPMPLIPLLPQLAMSVAREATCRR